MLCLRHILAMAAVVLLVACEQESGLEPAPDVKPAAEVETSSQPNLSSEPDPLFEPRPLPDLVPEPQVEPLAEENPFENMGDCGGIAGLACADGEFCRYERGICGDGDQMGFCAPKPEFCTAQHDPVCGCDDKGYGNACDAAAAGVSVRLNGAC